MRLRLHPEEYVVARNESGAARPRADDGLFASICGPDGNTIVCRYGLEPIQADVERGWRALQLDEAMGFGEVGVLAALVGPLAAAGVAVFVALDLLHGLGLGQGDGRAARDGGPEGDGARVSRLGAFW